ncbi:hypothetical protein D1224_15150 [Henriciella barbarensis]|uniref:DUF3035 domain-containing protein n=1 Tax=Henriciella barbarensis TaxID=86342 RepID=A0A399QQJ9_9PROT|nr:hypothetical protein [Henriciella barbarensis]RIJ20455.1 hypothetical protein D1224_15150 [Henriciella barbarensis]
MKQVAFFVLFSTSLALAACASKPAGQAVSQTRSGFTDAALSPLEDLNLRKDEVPEVLAAISNPYKVNTAATCSELAAEIETLDAVLPPDWDEVTEEEQATLSERAADTASDGVLGVVASEARGLIPYRGWVRRLSGANSHDRKVRAAFDRGRARRTYLKAIGRTKNCEGIAAPVFAEENEPAVVYRGDKPLKTEAPATSSPAPTPTATEARTPPQQEGPVDLRHSSARVQTTSSLPNDD